MLDKTSYSDWQKGNTQAFWGEIAPCEHIVQIYENDRVFLDVLAGFVGGGINAGDCVIVIATDAHMKALDEKLISSGVNIKTLISDDRYIALNAEECLASFMVNGWPDEELFMNFVSSHIEKANKKNRKVRAFGEMVALLWAQGHNGATVQLEHLWNKFCEKQKFSLFCAYPKSGFTQDINVSINHICSSHSRMIHGSENHVHELLYRNVHHKAAV
jgi:hypothetical protein